jgi:hypothetical protein
LDTITKILWKAKRKINATGITGIASIQAMRPTSNKYVRPIWEYSNKYQSNKEEYFCHNKKVYSQHSFQKRDKLDFSKVNHA